MDELEKYLKNHKDNIQDSFEWKNEDALWARIEQKLDEKTEQTEEKTPVMLGNTQKQGGSVTISHKNLWRAAAVFVLIFAGYGVFKYMNPNEETQINVAQMDLKKINPELAEVEVYYTSMIQQKKEELKKMNPENLVEFEKDFQSLDSTYQQLKIDFYKNPNHEQVTNAMIQNLKLRIEILERQIEILEKYSKPQKENKNEEVII
jgi:hypothetical protein